MCHPGFKIHLTRGMKHNNIQAPPVFDIKGSVLTVMVLNIRVTEPELLYPQLVKKIEQGRAFFTNAPVLVDLSGINETDQATFDCHLLADTLRDLGLVPVAVRGAAAILHEQVVQAGMGLLPTIKGKKSTPPPEDTRQAQPESDPDTTTARQPEQQQSEQPAPSPAAPSQPANHATRVITQPVRSGQQILAPDGDLIILSSVNAGAEVLAAGNIHVYGALRGRALAGIHGDTSACIFSMQCNPELVAVAGEYMVNERLDTTVVNQSIMISLADDRLQFTPLNTPYQERH